VDRIVRLLLEDGVRFLNNGVLKFNRLERYPIPGLHAEGEWKTERGERTVGVMIAPAVRIADRQDGRRGHTVCREAWIRRPGVRRLLVRRGGASGHPRTTLTLASDSHGANPARREYGGPAQDDHFEPDIHGLGTPENPARRAGFGEGFRSRWRAWTSTTR